MSDVSNGTATGTTTVAYLNRGVVYATVEQDYPLVFENIPANPSKVGVGAGVTKNMGNFESIRIDVSLARPCGTSAEAEDQAFEYTSQWVQGHLTRLIEDATVDQAENL